MEHIDPNRDSKSEPGEETEYALMEELEDLESLVEELEEAHLTGFAGARHIPGALRERMDHYDVRDVQQIRDRISHLNAMLDEDDADLTVSDS